jgi:kinesin family protein 18/19
MLGNEENPGIMLLTLQELFNKISSNSMIRDYNVKLLYIEIYNENIRDLLSNTDEYLDLREDHNKGLIVSGVNELNVTSANEVIQTLK